VSWCGSSKARAVGDQKRPEEHGGGNLDHDPHSNAELNEPEQAAR
jgi:hypothetical protein